MLISGILLPTKHKHIPEVPRSSGNNHSDMLFILDNGTMFTVEYKLNSLKSLINQITHNHYSIGILNSKVDKTQYFIESYRVFGYTGEDKQLEAISSFIKNENRIYGCTHYKSSLYSVYWWGYKNENSSLEGGLKNTKRISFFELYKKAIQNLQAEYSYRLDFYLVYKVLGFYEVATAKAHYKDAMKELENGKK